MGASPFLLALALAASQEEIPGPPDFSNRIAAKVPRVEWGIFGVAISPDGKTLAGSTGEASTVLWETATGGVLATLGGSFPDVAAHCVAFAPDGKTLVGRGSAGRRMSVWEVATRKELVSLDVGAVVRTAAFSPDGKTVATGEDGVIRLWESATGKELPPLGRLRGQVRSLAFTPDGTMLAAGAGSAVGVWEVGSRKTVWDLKHAEEVHAVALSPSTGILAARGAGGTVRLWDLRTGTEAGRLEGDADIGKPYTIVSLAYAPRGNLLASGASDGRVRLWSTAGGKRVARFGSGTGWVRSVAFSPDGKWFASSEGVVWNVAPLAGK